MNAKQRRKFQQAADGLKNINNTRACRAALTQEEIDWSHLLFDQFCQLANRGVAE